MNRYRVLCVVVLCAALTVGCPHSNGPAQPTATVGGTVVDAGTGAPIAGVRVFALAAGGSTSAIPVGTPEVTTDASGAFRIDNAPVGAVDLFARPGDASYGSATVRLTTLATGAASLTIRLVPPAVLVLSIDLTPQSLTVSSDGHETFTAAVDASDGHTYKPTWSVEGGIGSVNGDGLFAAGTAGHGFVRASLGTTSATAAVTVSECLITLEPDYIPSPPPAASAFARNSDGAYDVLVGYLTWSSRTKAWDAVSEAGGYVLRELPLGRAVYAVIPPEGLGQLRADPRITFVEPDGRVRAQQAQPAQIVPWGIRSVNADAAWGAGPGAVHVLPGRPTGAGVKVAVVDSGIDLHHPDLRVAGGTNIINPRADPQDDNGHGTFAAGIIGALDNDIGVIGVAPGCDLYAVKVLDSQGEGRVDDVVSGLEWCVTNGVRVINLSLGVTDHYVTLKNACDAAWAGGAGAVLCAASGNNEPVVYPGNYGSVISVGALDSTDTVASFSSQGPPVELSAPGVEVCSCGLTGTYVRNSGTSFSAPHVAGVAALLFSTGRYSDAAHVRQHLRNTAKDLGPPGRDETYGYGKVDAQKAIESQGCADVGGG